MVRRPHCGLGMAGIARGLASERLVALRAVAGGWLASYPLRPDLDLPTERLILILSPTPQPCAAPGSPTLFPVCLCPARQKIINRTFLSLSAVAYHYCIWPGSTAIIS